MSDIRVEIARIEAELDTLEATAERCRKTGITARIAVGAGLVLLVVALWRSDGAWFVTGIAATLGGLTLAGSTRTTREQVLSRIAALEIRRTKLIDGLDVGAGAGLLPTG